VDMASFLGLREVCRVKILKDLYNEQWKGGLE
jgi:hypothetical protein